MGLTGFNHRRREAAKAQVKAPEAPAKEQKVPDAEEEVKQDSGKASQKKKSE